MSDKSSDMNKTQIFKTGPKEVLIITPDGRLEAGEGLSHDEVSRELFKICSTYYGTRTAELERENAALREWVKEEGKRNDVCTYGILKEICEDCKCSKRTEAQP